ncbi:unnamed protein product [Rotaria sordida]|uniref:Uncharacterized protein n=1 Tax=Rotaria sordida TaxID=392033 RepID=A0A819JRF0_9BILA|nr:unnamed protein product [Rotaria sordida]CAF3937448.1 unnamed protein product [Rotaria sordida]
MSNNSDNKNNQQANMRSVKLQTNLCISPSCNLISEVICRHCSQQYCTLCFMCHRKNILDDMRSIYEQMEINRRIGAAEVITFIDKQAKDAHDQAKKLIDDAIDRIVQASKNIYTYIENRRQAKLGRLDECLELFDKDSDLLESKLKNDIFLPADIMLNLRHKYAYNMFDKITSIIETKSTELQHKNEIFFDDYRYYKELINLRRKWAFFQAALTTVYYPMKKDISLDKILTFLEYRHDRVLDNYREFLSTNEDSKELSLKPAEDLLNDLSFLSKKQLSIECDNFSYIDECENEIDIVEQQQQPNRESIVKSSEIKQEIEITPKTDSGHCDDETTSNDSWQIENDDYETRFIELSQSMKTLEKQFEDDLRLVVNNDQAN